MSYSALFYLIQSLKIVYKCIFAIWKILNWAVNEREGAGVNYDTKMTEFDKAVEKMKKGIYEITCVSLG